MSVSGTVTGPYPTG